MRNSASGAARLATCAREAGDQGAPVRAALGLQPLEQPLVQPLDQQPELGARTPALAGIGLGQRESGAPDLAAPLAVEIVEELGEAGDQVGLGEQRVDRHADPELLVDLLAPAAGPRVHAPNRSRGAAVATSDSPIATMTPFSGWRARVRFSRSRKASQPALSTAASESCVV